MKRNRESLKEAADFIREYDNNTELRDAMFDAMDKLMPGEGEDLGEFLCAMVHTTATYLKAWKDNCPNDPTQLVHDMIDIFVTSLDLDDDEDDGEQSI